MQFNTKLKLEDEFTSAQITALFKKNDEIRKRYRQIIKDIRITMLNEIVAVRDFLKENTSVKEFKIVEVKYAFEINLKMKLLEYAKKELLAKGQVDLKDVMKMELFDKKTIKGIIIEAYLLLLKDEVYNSYANARDAMQKLKELKRSI